MLIPLLLTALAVAPVSSPDGPDQDSAMTTAPATAVILDGAADPVAPPVGGAAHSTTPHGLTTDQQIAQWLAARSSSVPARHDESPVWRDDRKPHGEVSVGFGTGGYRDYAAAVSLPFGESGRLDISVRQSENAYPYGYGYGGGYGYDPYFVDSGYAFPGEAGPGAALDYERRVARPEGPPWARHAARPQQSAEE
ncbi:hypothetical protein [Brevundimonas sp.]|uniref:hypothetical protein n=1 Tax=Brevundimonas sp. TaxID=1871086 RepID=UPI002FC80B97